MYLGLYLALFACLGHLPGPSKPVGMLALGLNYPIALVGGGGALPSSQDLYPSPDGWDIPDLCGHSLFVS